MDAGIGNHTLQPAGADARIRKHSNLFYSERLLASAPDGQKCIKYFRLRIKNFFKLFRPFGLISADPHPRRAGEFCGEQNSPSLLLRITSFPIFRQRTPTDGLVLLSELPMMRQDANKMPSLDFPGHQTS